MRENLESLETFKERLAVARSRLLRHEPFLGFMTLELPTQILDGEGFSHAWASWVAS